jgi:hypothetical protein
MKRLTLFLILVLTFIGIGLTVSSAIAIDGPQANATVSFGQWQTDTPLDRIVADPPMGAGNNHELFPQIATIKAGGSVNFIISGAHVVAIYDDGTQPEDINTTNIETDPGCPATNATQAGGVLSDSNGRIYRGPCHTSSPFTTTAPRRDGVEVVQFSNPGTYLVICARKNHFLNPTTQQFEMFGFVRVLPGK